MLIFLGYLFTVINYICYCISRFVKTKQMMLFLDLVAKIFTILGLYCLGSLSGAYSFIITFFLLIVANIKEKYNKRWLPIFLLFQTLYIIVVLFVAFEGISSILVFINATLNLMCVWWFSPQKMRFVGGINSIFYLAYQICIKNWAGLIELAVIYCNFAAYIKYKKITKTEK